MNTQTTMPISEARKKIYQIADSVQEPNCYYTLTEKGRPKIVIMSAEEFESWAETLEVIKDFPNLKSDIKEADEEFRKGQTVSWDHYLAKSKNAISNRIVKKGGKKSRKNR